MADSLKSLQLIPLLLLFFNIKYVMGSDFFIEDGYVKGTNLTTRNGRNIEAFLGIPYAKPPVGRRRFEAPVKIEPWDDILVADTDPEQCPQLHDGRVVGAEDCLYVNAYTPKVLTMETEKLLPTMVYFHGGHFVRGNGSSTIFGPEYLLDKDIVLVIVQYRLGVLGFLSTGDQHAPGNFGLKDQVLALQWVKQNIVYFGGDPDKVTLFGQGAGGVSAQLHSISDLSAGLFNQYISQSGTAVCLWSYVDPEDCKDNVAKLGKHVNCPTTDSKGLVDCLRDADVQRLVDSDDIFGDTTYRFKTWGPTVEPRLHGAFLTIFPIYAIDFNGGTNVDRAIIGNVADEGLVLTAQYYSDPEAYEKVANNTNSFIHHILDDFFNFPAREVYVQQTEQFYFNGTEPSDKETFTKNMTSLISDIFFLEPADLITRQISTTLPDTSHVKIFFYSFEYQGKFSQTSRVIGSNESIGVAHGDDLRYFFPGTEEPELSESDKEMIDTMTELWTSFADTGIPSTKNFPDENYWKPYGDNLDYLKIGNNSDTSLSLHNNFNLKAIDFLNSLQFKASYGTMIEQLYMT